MSYYITTPIYYVNDSPTIGHCYTTIVADVAARFQRLVVGDAGGAATGSQVFFLTGTDEHADKIVTAAQSRGLSAQEWADRNAQEFRDAFDLMGCGYDDFIRTSEARHEEKVPGYIARLQEAGDVYKGEYTGWYDAGQEEYVTETTAQEHGYKSPVSGAALVKRTEPCYFFRLSRYQEALLRHMEAHPEFVQPEARRSEVLARVRAGLNDVPISRPVTDDPATQWGIRMPGDAENRIYVWIDALFNYYTAIDTPERRGLWPADVHVIGKDILWFHAVIWPAILMGLGVELPTTVYAHGWWVSEGRKMSKSLGNFIDLARLKAYAERYSLDALRYYLITQGPLGGGDADFAHARFVETYNADLANGIGNSVSRVGNMIEKYFDGRVPDPATCSDDEGRALAGHIDWPAVAAASVEGAIGSMARFGLDEVCREGVKLVGAVDGYINKTEPFKLAKRDEARGALARILYECAEALRIASLLLSPAMPTKMGAVWTAWGCAPAGGAGLEELARFGHGEHALTPGARITKGDPLFMRADPRDPAPGG